MRKISLAPYPGYVIVTRDKKEHARLHRRIFGTERSVEPALGLTTNHKGCYEFLVYAKDTVSLVHELGHVALDVFMQIGSDPTAGNGEPFCYLLSHLMEEARGW